MNFGVLESGTQINLHTRKGSYEKGNGRSRPGSGPAVYLWVPPITADLSRGCSCHSVNSELD